MIDLRNRNLAQPASKFARRADMIGKAFQPVRKRWVGIEQCTAFPPPRRLPADRGIRILAQSRGQRALVTGVGGKRGDHRPAAMIERPGQRVMFRFCRAQPCAGGGQPAFGRVPPLGGLGARLVALGALRVPPREFRRGLLRPSLRGGLVLLLAAAIA